MQAIDISCISPLGYIAYSLQVRTYLKGYSTTLWDNIDQAV